MILGSLYREKGQVGRAIQTHQQILQRPRLSRLEHGYVQLCLGLDYRRGGFVDRAVEALHEVLRLDPKNRDALLNLEKLHADQHQWRDAYDDPAAPRERLSRPSEQGRHRDDSRVSRERARPGSAEAHGLPEAARAIRSRHRAGPEGGARLPESRRRAVLPGRRSGGRCGNMGTGRRGRTRSRVSGVRSAWFGLRRRRARRNRFTALCRQLIADSPQDWRARLALARHLAAHGARRARRSSSCSRRLHINPHPHHAAPVGVAGAVRAAISTPRPRGALHRREPRGRVLPGPAHLPALPLPQQRAAVAMPALSRVEHVRGRAAHASERRCELTGEGMKSEPRLSGSGTRADHGHLYAGYSRSSIASLTFSGPACIRQCRSTGGIATGRRHGAPLSAAGRADNATPTRSPATGHASTRPGSKPSSAFGHAPSGPMGSLDRAGWPRCVRRPRHAAISKRSLTRRSYRGNRAVVRVTRGRSGACDHSAALRDGPCAAVRCRRRD